MTSLEKDRPSWARFFGGCALILLLISAAVWGLWTLRQRRLATALAVRESVLQPYWDALPKSDFAEVCERLCTPERNRKADPALVAQRFADFTQTHGPLQSTEVFSTTEGGVVGQAGQTLRVVVHLRFAKERDLSLAYNLFRQDPQSSWQIDSVTTSDRGLVMPTF